MVKRGKKIFTLLAAILEEPSERTLARLGNAIEIASLTDPGAGLYLETFRGFCMSHSLSSLRDIYTFTFDRHAACCPYVGHHLSLGERSRNLFMDKLKKEYTQPGAGPVQLPDHITVMLRSLVVQESIDEARDLINHCLIPALRKMIAQLKDTNNPYRPVLQAVLLILQAEDRARRNTSPEQYAMW